MCSTPEDIINDQGGRIYTHPKTMALSAVIHEALSHKGTPGIRQSSMLAISSETRTAAEL